MTPAMVGKSRPWMVFTFTFGLLAFSGCANLPKADDGDESGSLELRDFSFGQLDWLGPEGDVLTHDSSWGVVSWSYDPPLALTHYLSIQARTGSGDPVWIVENLPLFDTDAGRRDVRESAYFSLADLGYAEGAAVPRIDYAIGISRLAREEPVLSSGFVGAPVDDEGYQTCDVFDEPIEVEEMGDFGAPDRPAASGAQERATTERDIRPVQEAHKYCMAGSFARSLDWLNREHNLGLNKTAQGFYGDLVGAGVSRRAPGQTTGSRAAAWVGAKDTYAKAQTNGRIVTKVWDGANVVDPVNDVNEEGPAQASFEDWLKREMQAGEDVELGIAYKNSDGSVGGHVVTVVDVVLDKDGRVTHIKYRDDERQGNDSKGDTAVKNSPARRRADGLVGLGSRGRPIVWAVSESVV